MKKSFINRAAAKFFAAGTAAALALGFTLTGWSGIHRLRRGYCEVYCG